MLVQRKPFLSFYHRRVYHICNTVHLFTKRLEKHTESGPPVHWGVTIVIINTVIFKKEKKYWIGTVEGLPGSPHSLSAGEKGGMR